MKSYIYLFIVSTFVNAQTKESDYFRFYKGGEKYLKLVKYVYFDSISAHKKTIEGNQKTFFYIDGQRFSHNKNHKKDTCSSTFLKKIKLSKPSNLKQDVYKYFKKKK